MYINLKSIKTSLLIVNESTITIFYKNAPNIYEFIKYEKPAFLLLKIPQYQYF